MTRRKHHAIASLLLVLPVLLQAGCLSGRTRALDRMVPRNIVVDVDKKRQELAGGGRGTTFMVEFDRSDRLSLHILQVAKEARLKKRYHARQDLTLICLEGSAIVNVQDKRYFVESPATVFVPHYYYYSVIPHKTQKDFTAVAVFSPPYDSEDLTLLKE